MTATYETLQERYDEATDSLLVQRRYANGVRVVVRQYGEAWYKQVIVPRALAIQTLAANAELGFGGDPVCACPVEHLHVAGYGGPGRWFADEPYKEKRPKLRRYVVFNQHGGMDV